MYESVFRQFPAFTEACEGRILWPYLDWNGDPTVGAGCIVNTLDLMLALPWRINGEIASRDVVIAQWNDLRSQVRLSKLGAKYAAAVTQLRLTEADVDALTLRRMNSNDIELHKHFLAFERLPADGQMLCHSMAWAMGVARFLKLFPKFTKAVNARDWATAFAECLIDATNNPGIPRRNAANRICAANALAVQHDIDHAGRARGSHLYVLDQLYWPQALPNPTPSPVA